MYHSNERLPRFPIVHLRCAGGCAYKCPGSTKVSSKLSSLWAFQEATLSEGFVNIELGSSKCCGRTIYETVIPQVKQQGVKRKQ